MPSPYATNEDPTSLWYEQANYLSTHISAIGYGIHVVTFGIVTYFTITKRKITRNWITWLVFNTTLFLIGTINIACSIRFNEDAWINERNYPGGPYAFIIEQQTRPVLTLGNTCSILASFMADGLLLYRAMVMWDFVWYIILLPTVFYLACIALSVMVVIQLANPSLVPILNLTLPVWIVLMIINIMLSAMIATRILMLRKRLITMLGKDHGGVYTSTASVIVEAALPFNILSIVLLGLFGSEAAAQSLFVPLLVQVECITPELIILWVILGRSLSRETRSSLQTPNAIRFADPSGGVISAIDIETATRSSSDQSTPRRGLNAALDRGDKESAMSNSILPMLSLRTFDSDKISIPTPL